MIELHLVLVDQRVKGRHEIHDHFLRDLFRLTRDKSPAFTNRPLNFRAIIHFRKLPDSEPLLRHVILLLNLLKLVETMNSESLCEPNQRLQYEAITGQGADLMLLLWLHLNELSRVHSQGSLIFAASSQTYFR